MLNWLGADAACPSDTNKMDAVVTGVSTDTRQLVPGDLFIPLIGERFDGHDFLRDAAAKGAKAVLCQTGRMAPELSCPVVYVSDTLHALQQLARAYRRHLNVHVVAVTGSNGKTTAKELIASVLAQKFRVHKTKGNLNNHIGLPLTLLNMPPETEVAVVELGMNHPGEIAALSRLAAPDAAVITNVGEAHIEYFGDRRGIAQAKLEIVDGLRAGGPLFINGDDPLLLQEAKKRGRAFRTVGVNREADERAADVQTDDGGVVRFTAVQDDHRYKLHLLGAHNVLNALFAIAVGRWMGLSPDAMARGLQAVQPPDGRLQLKQTLKGMWVLDDSYNANPTAVKAGIDTLMALGGQRKKWVLLGDILELGQQEEAMHRDVGNYIAERPVERLLTVGARAKWIHDAFVRKTGDRSKAVHLPTVEAAIRTLHREERPDIVLFVKASRGAALERVVKALCPGGKRDLSVRGD